MPEHPSLTTNNHQPTTPGRPAGRRTHVASAWLFWHESLLMRTILLFFLMMGIAVARPPDPHTKKTPPTVPVQAETVPDPAPLPVPTPPPATPPKVEPAAPTTPAPAVSNSAPETDPADAPREVVKSSPDAPVNGIRLQWFGHAFVYLTSANGIRVAIDPFTPGTVKYDYPQKLPADVALISCENDDRTGSEDLFGTPLLFRSVTGVGMHYSNGLLFKGIESWRDAQKSSSNTIYTFTMDTVRFCALGNLGYPLDTEQKREIGKADIVIVSAGNRLLRPVDFAKLVESTGAKYIIPVAYLTNKNNTMDLRALEEFDLSKYPVEKVAGSTFVFQKDKLPTKPTVLMLESP